MLEFIVKKQIMLRNFPVAAILSLTLLTFLGGCSGERKTLSPTDTLRSPENQPKTVTKIEPPEPKITPLAPANPNTAINTEVQQFVKSIIALGAAKTNQGIWIQTENQLLANYQGTVPLPAASVTKSATTLVALKTWGPEHQFITLVSATGPIENGELQGNLVIQGGEDPFFVWEEAVALGNVLNQIGIKKVKGNLVIVGKFYMNFETTPDLAGNLLKQGLNSELWNSEAEQQYLTLPPNTPKPKIVIAGLVQVVNSPPGSLKLLVRHRSLPLAELVKKMNMYSNNMMAQMLADSVGGGKVVAQKAAEAVGVPATEIQLINGSGLGPENKISPRAAVGIFQAIDLFLKPYHLTIADVFAIAGRDLGVLNGRKIPELSVVKTGTLNQVASIAGAIPTQTNGPVWVAIMNVGDNLEEFRAEQDNLLNSLLNQWGPVNSPPSELTPTGGKKNIEPRDEIVK